MMELTIYNVKKHYGDTMVLNNASFRVFEGEKVGLVGVNGSGKSTILKILAGIEPIDIDYRKICEGKSRITISKGASIGYLEQLPSYPADFKVNHILNLAFQELYIIEQQLRELEDSMESLQGAELERALQQYSQLQQMYDIKGGYDKEEKFSKVCIGLKFDDVFLDKEFNILSGGEKTTVLLGKLLLESPDIMLLDEPTNHLDMESMEWLENYLKKYRGIVIIVSHDRYFLDKAVTKIVEVENMECETYEGNYSDYIKQKEENMLLQFQHYTEQKKEVTQMEKAIKELRDWAMRADNNKFFRRAVSMQKKLDKMERIDKPVFERQTIKLNFISADRSGYEIIKVSKLSKSFENRIVFKEADLYITLGERVALIGPNGSGKTTFIKMLLGETNTDNGKVGLGANLKIAYLPQNITFNCEEDTVLECFREDKFILEGKAREYLSKFMFFGKSVFKKVKQLSGGEKVRLKLSILLYDKINLLILDEPTNHLDIDSMEVLEEALEDFSGTILFISHDRYFINKVCNRVVAIENNKFASYTGNYDNYRQKKDEKRLAVNPVSITIKSSSSKNINMVNNHKSPDDLAQIEITIKSLEDQISEISENIYTVGADYEELNRLYSKREDLNKELEEILGEWVELSNED